jgi:hypothetical protein
MCTPETTYVMLHPVSQEMGGMSRTYTRTGSSSTSPVLPRTVCGCRSKDASCSEKTVQERLHGVLVCAQFSCLKSGGLLGIELTSFGEL